jgi:thioredoxin reductase (NADPH)
MGTSFTCLCESGAAYEGKTAILAVGVESAGKIDGEVEYTGRGVSYCATCDGALYKGKTIAVVCTSKRFEGEVEYLAKIAQKTYFIPLYKGPEVQAEGLETRVKAPVKVEGALKVQRLVFKDETLDVDGVFMLKESVPPSSLVGGLETKDGHVTVDRHARTNLAGLFAAGDCTGRPYQYAKAVGEGNVAAHSVVEFLREKKA